MSPKGPQKCSKWIPKTAATRSQVENYNKRIREEINELRKAESVLEWNFKNTKQTLVKYRKLTGGIMAKANRFLDEHARAKEELEDVENTYVRETINFEHDFNNYVTIVEKQRMNQEEALVQERRHILREKHKLAHSVRTCLRVPQTSRIY